MEKFLITLFAVVAGAVGFLLANFWFKPILRFKEIKSQVASGLIFYANVINADNLNEEMKERLLKRVEANRRHSADLSANYDELPKIYKYLLNRKGIYPKKASKSLMGLSNTFEWRDAEKRVDEIKSNLGIKDSE